MSASWAQAVPPAHLLPWHSPWTGTSGAHLPYCQHWETQPWINAGLWKALHAALAFSCMQIFPALLWKSACKIDTGTWSCSHGQTSSRHWHAGLQPKQKGTVQNLSSVSKPDLEIQTKSDVREVVRHSILNKTWVEFFSEEIFPLSFWRKMRIVLAERQGPSTAADCCSPLCCHSGSDIPTLTQISKVPKSGF